MRKLWLIFSQAVTVGVAVLFVVATFKPEWLARPPHRWLPLQGGAPAVTLPVTTTTAPAPPTQALSQAAQRASPAVVSVTSNKGGASAQRQNDPWLDFFFGRRGAQQPPAQTGFGSGVIVSESGYLLTNNHVVAEADAITVRLSDGREAQATLIGTDPDTDLAVLKINLDRLPSVTLGQMEQLHVGDAVLAIGNPFNFGQTVTSGIVSALGRSGLGLSTFENFIQTDAAINPGNSGGALVDASGNLVGINTAIYSRSGGNLGIGFAIPIDVAHQVMDALVRDGQVTRGWIGVQLRELNPDFVEAFKLPVSEGVLITGVLQGGPAAAAQMKPGDVVVAVAGAPVRTVAQLLRAVAALPPGQHATLAVQRGNDRLDVPVEVGRRPRQEALDE
ncbi:MAG: trypsin-like peptidase domain-containing protein [Proteobacteria bacterium]|nr:trypsin-like peptidase domain-containing protein [Pseudomonadota bacterium]